MTSYTFENVDPLLEEVMAELDSGRLQAGVNPCRTSSEMQNFIKQQIFAAPCSGTMTIDQTLDKWNGSVWRQARLSNPVNAQQLQLRAPCAPSTP